jgi:hypothetical protein
MGLLSGPELLQDHSSLDRLAEADLIAKQEPMRIARDDAVDNADLVGLHIDSCVAERDEIIVQMLQPVETRDELQVELPWRTDLAIDHPGRRVKRMIRSQVSLRNDLLEETGGTEDSHLPLRRGFTHERAEDPGLIGALAAHLRRQDSAYKRRVPRCENTRRELARRVPFDLDLSARDAADHPDAVPTRPPDDGPFYQLLAHCLLLPSASSTQVTRSA